MKRHGRTPSTLRSSPTALLMWWTIVIFMVVVPLFLWPSAAEPFRLPKELLFRLEALVSPPLMVATAVLWPGALARPPRFLGVLSIFAVLWSAVCAVASTNRQLSADSMITIVAAIILLLSIVMTARERPILWLYAVIIPAVVNALVFLSETSIQGVSSDVRTALLGNRDDVGSLLCAPGIAAVALAFTEAKRWLRYLHGIAAAVIVVALAVGAVTSLTAFLIAVIVVGFLHSGRRGALFLVVGLISSAGLAVALPSVRSRVTHAVRTARMGDLDAFTSYRLTPYYAAWEMTKDHPVTGVGPGSFRFEFFDYKIAVERNHHDLVRSVSRYSNFGEVHNDHLQVLAETGFVGYALLIAALVCLGRLSFKRGDDIGRRSQVVRFLALPVAIAFAIEALAHFPVELAAPRMAFLFIGGLCVAWSLPEKTTAAIEQRRQSKLRLALAAGCALLAAAVAVPLVSAPFHCSTATKRAQSRTDLAAQHETSDLARIIARESLNQLAMCHAWRYDDTNVWMIRAANLRILGRLQEAVATYEHALRIDHRPELYLNVGQVLLELGQTARAKDALLKAVLFNFHMLDEIENPEIHDWLEHVIFEKYAYLFPKDRSPTFMLRN